MRYILTIFLSFLLINAFSKTVTITGQCKEFSKSKGRLSIDQFNFYYLIGKYQNRTYKSDFKITNGKFSIVLDYIDSCVTKCCLKFGRKKIFISFFAGDSINISFNYSDIQNTLTFSGKGANKCYYTNYKYTRFIFRESEYANWTVGKEYIEAKVSDLRRFNELHPMGDKFYRIAYSTLLCEEYNNLLTRPIFSYNLEMTDSMKAEVRKITKEIGLNNVAIFSNISYYSFITRYFDTYYDKSQKVNLKYYLANQYFCCEFLDYYKAYLIVWLNKCGSKSAKKEFLKGMVDDFSGSASNHELIELIQKLVQKKGQV